MVYSNTADYGGNHEAGATTQPCVGMKGIGQIRSLVYSHLFEAFSGAFKVQLSSWLLCFIHLIKDTDSMLGTAAQIVEVEPLLNHAFKYLMFFKVVTTNAAVNCESEIIKKLRLSLRP